MDFISSFSFSTIFLKYRKFCLVIKVRLLLDTNLFRFLSGDTVQRKVISEMDAVYTEKKNKRSLLDNPMTQRSSPIDRSPSTLEMFGGPIQSR